MLDKVNDPKAPHRARFAVASQGARERARRKAAIKEIHVEDGVFKRASQAFTLLVNRCEDGAEPFALVIPAPSGAGKTCMLEHLAQDPRLAPFKDEMGQVMPLVRISAPSPCTLKSLGIQLHKQLTGIELSPRLNSHEIWVRLRTNLYNLNVSVLMIDEMHHLFETNDSGGVRQVVASTLKSLLLGEMDARTGAVDKVDGVAEAVGVLPPSVAPRPIGLVLSGMPEVKDVIAFDLQLLRRSKFVTIRPIKRSKSDLEGLKKFVELIQNRLDFRPLPDLANDDMLLRLHAATGGYRGRVAFLIKEAAYLAIDLGATTLDGPKHFARVFEDIYQVGAERNPFLIPDISTLGPIKEIDPPRAVTRLKGKKAIAEGDSQ